MRIASKLFSNWVSYHFCENYPNSIFCIYLYNYLLLFDTVFGTVRLSVEMSIP